jgi:hypothetical protein
MDTTTIQGMIYWVNSMSCLEFHNTPDQKHQYKLVEENESCRTDWFHDESCHISMCGHTARHSSVVSHIHIPYQADWQPEISISRMHINCIKRKKGSKYKWRLSSLKLLVMSIKSHNLWPHLDFLKVNHDSSFSTTWNIPNLHFFEIQEGFKCQHSNTELSIHDLENKTYLICLKCHLNRLILGYQRQL